MKLDRVLPEYTELRNPDAEAICDLAMYNYIEVRGGEVGIGRIRALWSWASVGGQIWARAGQNEQCRAQYELGGTFVKVPSIAPSRPIFRAME